VLPSASTAARAILFACLIGLIVLLMFTLLIKRKIEKRPAS